MTPEEKHAIDATVALARAENGQPYQAATIQAYNAGWAVIRQRKQAAKEREKIIEKAKDDVLTAAREWASPGYNTLADDQLAESVKALLKLELEAEQ